MSSDVAHYDLQRFFTMSRDLLCIAGFDGYFKLLSPAWQSALGYSDEELTAKPFIDFVHVDDRASTVAEAAKLSVGGVTVAFKNRFHAKDGSLRRLAWSATADLEKGLLYAIARDVTAEDDALQALHKSIELQRGLLNAANYSVISTDPDGVIQTFNSAAERMLGYSAAEMVGKQTPAIVHEVSEVVQRAAELSQELGETIAPGFDVFVAQSRRGHAEEREWTYIHKDGSRLPVLLSVTALRDAHDKIIGYLGIASDISARKLAEYALRSSEQRYGSVITAMAEGVVVQDTTGAIVSWNRSAETILGLSGEQLAGRSSIDPRWHCIHEDGRLFPGSDHPAMVTLRSGVAQTDVVMGVNAPDGSLHWISINTQPIYEPDSESPQAVVATFKDITLRRSQEQALRDGSERLRAILDTVIDPIITIDERGFVESFNPAAESVFEFRAAEVIGRNVNLLMPEPFHTAHDGYLARYLATGERRVIGLGREVSGRRKSGATFPMELAVSELKFSNKRMFVGVVRDITERKRLDRMKSEFVSTVSHELRTPMNAILGFTQLLSYDSNLTASQKANLAKVRKAGEHLLDLINDVLDLSRIEAGKVTLSLEPVVLGDLLLECRNMAQPLADARNIRLLMDVEAVADACVHVDRTRLRQVLLNLVSNAVKYNRDGGSVWVTCASVASRRVRVAVRDNGRGIALDQQAQLFQPFNRLGAERGEIEGTGIGLTITKQLVELMQGDIGFESSPGTGSTFWVEFAVESAAPASLAGRARDAAPVRPNRRSGTHRVLYVEDNPVNLELVQALCAQFWPNMQLLSASTAEVGLELAAAQRPDLILMDINLPGMDGYQALARLQADANLCRIPVLAVTANAMKENIERGRAAGFADYLTKPIDIPKFIATLDRLLAPLPDHSPAPEGAVRVLLAEDNLVNQEVARGLLEILGYAVDVVADGRAAVEAVQRSHYAAVLMDCEMPVLDGYAAAVAIRDLEGNTRHTPIIAVTAHAAGESAAQRQSAGMDDYLAKPINADRLRAVLERWTSGREPAIQESKSILDAHATGQLRDLLGPHAVPIVDSLLSDLPRRLELLRVAIESGDVAAVRHEAHAMKGSSSNLGASTFAELCTQLGDLCKSGELPGLPGAYVALEQEFRQRVTPALDQFKQVLLQGGVPPAE